MLNKKVLKIPIMLLLIISLVVTYIPIAGIANISDINGVTNVWAAEDEDEYDDEEYGEDETGEGDIDPNSTDDNYQADDAEGYTNKNITARFILDGVSSIRVAVGITASDSDIFDSSYQTTLDFSTINNGGSIQMPTKSAYTIEGISNKYIGISSGDTQEEAANGTFIWTDKGQDVEFSVDGDDEIIYVKVKDSLGTGDELDDNPTGDPQAGRTTGPEREQTFGKYVKYIEGQEFPYKKGQMYTGLCKVVGQHMNPHKSTITVKHTSGLLREFKKNVTARCISPGRGLATNGWTYSYKATILAVKLPTASSPGKVQVSIKYYPKKGSGVWTSWGTVVNKWPQAHWRSSVWIPVVPANGYISILKKSEEQISKNNDMYNKKAKYQLFKDKACKTGATFANGNAAILETNKDTGKSSVKQIASGTYYLKEVEAPEGHARSKVVKKVKVSSKHTENSPLVVTYTNKEKWGDLLIEKLDSETKKFLSEGDAKIETVKFKIEYFDNTSASGTPVRTWTFKIPSAEKNGKNLTEDMFVSGSALYKIDGKMVFPLGSYKLTEITPVGYLDNTTTYTLKLVDSLGKVSTKTYVGVASVKGIENQVIRGGLEIEKRDKETGAQWPLGDASFVGTKFDLINSSDAFIYYKKGNKFVGENNTLVDSPTQAKKFNPGDVIDTLVITADGVPATTDTDGDGKDYSLPYGTYKLKEVSVDDKEQGHGSYLPTEIDKGTEITIYVNEHGKVHTTKDQPKTNQTKVESQDAFYNQVKRSDIQIKKNKIIQQQSENQLKGIPFVIKSETTKEAHVIVCLDNSGYSSTKASVNLHTDNTNFNDYMINADGTPKLDSNGMVDTSKIDYYAGVWWGKDSLGNETKKVDNKLSALPYDTYEIYELPCEQNKGFRLYNGKFEISRNSDQVEEYFKDIVNEVGNLKTTAKDPVTGSNIGTNESESIIDTISYTAFIPGKYHVVTTLMDKETEKPVQVDGKDLIVEKDVDFTHGEGSVDVEITFPKGALKGKNVVVFEEVYRLDENGKPITETNGKPYDEHKDINDEGQTIHYPDIKTTATDKIDGDHDVLASGTQTIVDVVEYKNVSPNKEYTMKGVLMDKETGKPLLDKDQKEITAEKTFTAEQSSGTVELEFTFDASLLAGKTLVAFEDLEYEGKKIATHADINDHNQSVYIPKIKTKFMTNDGEKDIDFSQENVVLVDNVEYKNLIPGETYEATVNVATKDGELLKDDSNNPYEGKETFTAEAADGTYQVKLPEIPVSKITQDIVAFETLRSIPNAPTPGEETPTKEPKIVAEHKDVNDKDQTIRIPKIGTSAKDQADGDKAILGKPDQTLVDTISYDGLIPGEEYIAKGQLANPKTGELLKDESGNEITSETKFTPSAEKGTVEVQIKFDARDYMAGSVVVFEEIYRVPKDNTKPQRYVGWHKDTKDTNQTLDVYMELYVTIAKADADKVKYFLKGAEITVFDGEGNIAKDKNGKECVGITDEKGEVKFTVLYLEGMKFYAQETKAPKGYQINKEKFEVKPETLDEEGADILISILDKALVIPPMGPKTGDTTKILIYLLLALIGTTSVVAVRRKLKK